LADDGSELQAVATPETFPFAPGSVYAATKAAQELLVTSAAQALGLHATVVRLQNVYGEGQSLQNPYTGIISIFFNRARQGLPIDVYEDGRESRDFVHVGDVVESLRAAMLAETPPGAVINVGSGTPTSVLALAGALVEAARLAVPVNVTGQFRVGDIRHCYADISRMRSWLGVAPGVSVAEGLDRFCAWAVGQPIQPDRLASATEELRRKGLTGA
jgi:dTDP-L-rhamnose 4-epimerase